MAPAAGPGPANRYLGKFRGRVVDNDDPLRIGRITALVPDVLGDEPSTWAMPCFPFTGEQAGQYVVPAEGAGVWIEFEQGDASFPIWTGCWYGDAGELPRDAQAAARTGAEPVVIENRSHHRIVLHDSPDGGILLQAPGGAFVRISNAGVQINSGAGTSIVLDGDQVDVNEGRLTVPKKS
ncbi:phage baseplate assembly protein V [Streptomyces sp. WAC 00631]|uniref:phage baseplate assembly protein V n=1 Tax=unclassified Streptomyces TaxID=2593676 RepID=UPI000F7ACC57|nr:MULTISPECIES: phage baseplate assembly protein V [unclassified Streptomyces]MCC5031711.1 phage baseplate assembly protein V [Streptomyces sp. WAC 00631]MCC9739856.1 phage baseplate assembly protein V [Streptomyces sp. MNU89]